LRWESSVRKYKEFGQKSQLKVKAWLSERFAVSVKAGYNSGHIAEDEIRKWPNRENK
jgi:hypothetical protein